jgi:cyclopropane-fatty-acyl-phospholipid synthase
LLARRLAWRALASIDHGVVHIIDGTHRQSFGRPADGLQATITIHNPRTYRCLLLGGNLGASEAFMQGEWTCDDLVALCRIFILHDQRHSTQSPWLLRLLSPAAHLYHALRRNTREGSRRNIAAHYDLGNDFYRLFLDETMMYSSAIFPRRDSTLADASRYKLDRICRKLELTPQDHVLEIGTGWGGFALHAARHYGCRVTTTTISREQYRLASERVEAAGLSDRIEVLLQDYRDLEGEYDKIVSIEMIEAVGAQFVPTFFQCCEARLKPQGRMLLQGITIAEWAFARHLKSVDFIKRYIFPGSTLISMGSLAQAVATTDLRFAHVEDIGLHYARTLREWRRRFLTRLDDVIALGFDERFLRMWDFYLASCEAGFSERHTSDVQVVLARGSERQSDPLFSLDPVE